MDLFHSRLFTPGKGVIYNFNEAAFHLGVFREKVYYTALILTEICILLIFDTTMIQQLLYIFVPFSEPAGPPVI